MNTGITSKELSEYIEKKIPMLILDIRDKRSFMEGHIEGSANARCTNMQQKQVIMSKIPRDLKIILIDEDGTEASQNASMMAKFGFDAHFLIGGIKEWKDKLIKSTQETTISNEKLWEGLQSNKDVFLLDVREPQEFSEFKIPGATNIPLSRLFSEDTEKIIPKDKKVVTICSHGNRSMVATFALAQKGIEATSLEGGMAAWNQFLNPTTAVEEEGLTIIQLEKIGKGCLSYILCSENEAVVIDPTYPPSKFRDLAEQKGWKISKVLDTHQHADHVSAARELASITKAELYLSDKENYNIECKKIKDEDTITFGNKKVKVIHTPGHTKGSMSFVVDDKYAFTGDILFVEGVGRPDLRDKAEEFAGELYDTIHNKILRLSEDVMIFPAHHSEGVSPVKNGIYFTTIESIKKSPLLSLDKESFVKKMIDITMPRPMNYSLIIKINKGSIPVIPEQIPDLEMGPNRCSIRIQ